MTLRSLLFAPGDSPGKMEKACGSGADAVILDLEDSVAETAKPEARRQVAAFLSGRAAPRTPQVWVRINPLSTPFALADLAAVAAAAPDGIVLPKPDSAADLVKLDHYLTALEAAAGLAVGAIRILPLATETARSIFTLESYIGASARLSGLTWGAEDLPAAVGAATSREADGSYTPPYQLARSLCLFAAAAGGVDPVDTVYPAFRDLDGLAAYAARARRDGFAGMLAIHPAQVAVINQAFTPTAEEVAHAHRIIAAFDAAPGAGAVALDGRMVDLPHLKQAQRILALDRLETERASGAGA